MPFNIERATTADPEAIAHIFSSNESDAFWRLQMGTVDPSSLNTGLTERIAEMMQKPNVLYVVARDSDSGAAELIKETSADEDAEAADAYRAKLIPGMNESLVMEFREKYEEMRKSVARSRRHYLLGNLGTLPTFQRKGAASGLTKWPFDSADREGVPVCLDTDEAGYARTMYEKLGFQQVGELSIDLAKHGGRGIHTHIAMIREPRPF